MPRSTRAYAWENERMEKSLPGRRRRILNELLASPLVVISLTIIGIFVLAGLLAPWIAPYDPHQLGWGNGSLPPAWSPGGSPAHLLGTDPIGRDLFSRLIYGARTALLAGLIAAPLAGLLGLAFGLAAGYLRGLAGELALRIIEIFGGIPGLIFSILWVFLLRETPLGAATRGISTLVLGFALAAWVDAARLVRAAVIVTRQELFIEAAEATGVPHGRILLRHILPNCLGLLAAWLSLAVARVVTFEALLGYLNVRVTSNASVLEFTATSWGGMFYEGRSSIFNNPTMLLAPAVCVMLVVASFTLVSDRLRDAMDPRSQSSIF